MLLSKKLNEHCEYIYESGVDMSEIYNWQWWCAC
jgi:phosphoketolase